MDNTLFPDGLSLPYWLKMYPQNIFRKNKNRNMMNKSKVNTLEAVAKEDAFLVSIKEDQKEEQMVEKQSQCRDAKKKLAINKIGEYRGGKIVVGDIERPVVSPNILGLKALKISRSMEGVVGNLLMEWKFFVED